MKTKLKNKDMEINVKCMCCGTKENVKLYSFCEKYFCKPCYNYLREDQYYNQSFML